ncbi:serine/threonine-protein kinase-like protein CCR4 [Rhodamnia argentea]|uniref:Serine/threonine-protein kinase-like protein CCR4 n=1 Tax=Rhodamnia argentea TaxID=178133 RepID=A0A8B8PB88_9MYRT|nr:serine/threonine-protein kinase-like protein CCR4 [Rhodamnia argentea]
MGAGSAGSVYRGFLDDGREVAIEWTNVTKKGFQDRMFINEIKTLRHFHHNNLVGMLGFYAKCSECALVYEYMKNGSLFYLLHTIRTSTLMSWNTRLKAALDVARGIQYLHEFAGPQMPNFFLRMKFQTSRMMFSAPLVNYVAPEYYLRNSLTTKSDVYGYGIVLLELLSGYKALHWDEDGSRHYIVDVVVPRIVRGEIDQPMDPNMPIPTPLEMRAVTDMACLAVQCVQIEAGSRPSMTDIVDRLRSALAQCLSMLCDNMKANGSYNSSLALEEEIARKITEEQSRHPRFTWL